MNEAADLDAKCLQQRSPQAALHHRYVGYDSRAPCQSLNPGGTGSWRNKYFINHAKIAAGMNKALQNISFRFGKGKPITSCADDIETFQFDRMGLRTVEINSRLGFICCVLPAGPQKMMSALRCTDIVLIPDDRNAIFAQAAVRHRFACERFFGPFKKSVGQKIMNSKVVAF